MHGVVEFLNDTFVRRDIVPQTVYTIGFAQKPLRDFVQFLKENKVTRIVDIRLNNTSQLSGFAKKNDLAYILELVNIDYTHELSLAPTQELLSNYRKKKMPWDEFKKAYTQLLEERNVEETFDFSEDEAICFLCSEHEPYHCHRTIAAEYLHEHQRKLSIVHLY